MRSLKNILTLLSILVLICGDLKGQLKVEEVEWGGVGCYKIMMDMGTVYFEKDNGVSGFKSFVDNEGNDWIASCMDPGPNGEWRGFPNSPGNFGHAGRDSNSKSKFLDGKKEGEYLILESSNHQFTYQYWFFPNHIAIKVLKSSGDYHFLYEGVPGGEADSADYFVTADGLKHTPLVYDSEFDDFSPEWFYVGDADSKYHLFLGKTPDDEAPNENHRQLVDGVHNMELYSFGRNDDKDKYLTTGMSGNEHVCIIGFISSEKSHNDVASFIERVLSNPFAYNE